MLTFLLDVIDIEKPLPARRHFLLGFVSALLLLLSYPVIPSSMLWPLAWIALVPLLLSLSRGGWCVGLIQIGAFAFPFLLGTLFWVWWMGAVPWVLLSLTQCAYLAIFTLSAAVLAPLWTPQPPRAEQGAPGPCGRMMGLALLPSTWIVVEWLRSLGRLSIPWAFLSETQKHLYPLVSTARWWGAYGVSFLVVLFNVCVAVLLLSRKEARRSATLVLVFSAAVIVLASGLSVLTFPAERGAAVRVALIQGNIFKEDPNDPGYRSHVLDVYTRLSLDAARKYHPQVIVWGETVTPGSLRTDPGLQARLAILARQTGALLLVGSPDFSMDNDHPGQLDTRNSVQLMSPGGTLLGSYYKQHLVPFGEYVPGRAWLPFLNDYGVPSRDLIPGTSAAPINSPLGQLGALICYESMYPQLARATVRTGAQAIFVVTNDEWFGGSSAPYDHAAVAPFRAAETGRWVAEDGSTGVSLFADPLGREHQPTRMFTRTVDVGEIRLENGETLYTRLGDWPAMIATLILLGGWLSLPRSLRSNGIASSLPGEA